MKKIKQFSELTAFEISKLKKAQRLRAEKRNRHMLDSVRCVGVTKKIVSAG